MFAVLIQMWPTLWLFRHFGRVKAKFGLYYIVLYYIVLYCIFWKKDNLTARL